MPLTREQILEQDRACRVYQARADDALKAWGMRAPGPTVSDDPRYPEKYRRDLCYLAKKRLPEGHELRNFQVKHIPLVRSKSRSHKSTRRANKPLRVTTASHQASCAWSRRKIRTMARR